MRSFVTKKKRTEVRVYQYHNLDKSRFVLTNYTLNLKCITSPS